MKKLIFIFLVFISTIYSKDADEEGQLKEGNLALPPSQQLSPLFSFGQNIVGKDVLQAYSYFDWLKGKKQKSILAIPAILYGITEDLSVFINVPVFIKNKVCNNKSSGISDIYAQFEYAAYSKSSLTAVDMWTLLATLFLPTGSNKKNPANGLGSPAIFLGTTLSHLAIDWYVYTSYGAILTTPKNNNKMGNQFLYQFGFGRNIPTSPEWILTWILEFNGIYNQRDKFCGLFDVNSGGNIIYIGPSLWLSSKKFIFQAGISFPALQKLFGKQSKVDYFAAINFGYTF